MDNEIDILTIIKNKQLKENFCYGTSFLLKNLAYQDKVPQKQLCSENCVQVFIYFLHFFKVVTIFSLLGTLKESCTRAS